MSKTQLFSNKLQVTFFDFFFTEGFISIFKLFLILFAKFETVLMETKELKDFISSFNKCLENFNEYQFLKDAMKNTYMHNDLFNKIRNTLIAEKQESLQKNERTNLGMEVCPKVLPYCLTARPSRSLKNDNFSVRKLDVLGDLKYDFFLKPLYQKDIPENIRFTETLRKSTIKKNNKIEIEKMFNSPQTCEKKRITDSDFKFDSNSGNKERFSKIKANFDVKSFSPDFRNHINVAYDKTFPHEQMMLVRCEHLCYTSPEDAHLKRENLKKKQIFFAKSNEMVLDYLGPQIEGLLVDRIGRQMRIMRDLAEKHDDMQNEKNSSEENASHFAKMRAHSFNQSASNLEFQLELEEKDIVDDLEFFLDGKQSRTISAYRQDLDFADEYKIKKKYSLNEFKVNEFLDKYRVISGPGTSSRKII